MKLFIFISSLAIFLGSVECCGPLFPDDPKEAEVMLITGGRGNGYGLSSVEVFDPNNSSWFCDLPDMRATRHDHAAAGLTVCGGSGVGGQTCETFNPESGSWSVSHHLRHRRREHVMWASPEGPVVLGGSSQNSTELLTYDGTTKETFKLLYSTE